MDVWMVILRLIHVLSGVFWAGATIVFASHITPSVKATGEAGQKFMGYLSGKAKISNALGIAGTLALLSGLTMYVMQGWENRLDTASGIGLTIGVILGAGAYFHGLFVQRKAILGMQSLGMQIAASGGPPSPDQAAAMGKLAGKVERNGVILAYVLALTVVLMGTFQYL